MKRLALALAALIAIGASASAQVVTNPAIPPDTVCSYLTSPPTLTNGQASWLRCDSTGALITTASGGGGGSVTQGTTPWVVSGQGTAGTAATGVVTVQGIASMTPFLTTTTLNAETTKVIGTVNQGTSPWVTSGTSTVSGTVSATQGTSPWVVSNSGTFAVQAAQSGTWTVQPGNTANTTPWLVLTAPSSSSTIGIVPVVSTAGEASHVLKASAGNTYSAYATNLTSTQGFFLLLNATSAPADGAVTPLACAPLAPNGIASLNYSPGPPGVFGTGITAVVTSAATCFTKTTGVITAFISGSVQ